MVKQGYIVLIGLAMICAVVGCTPANAEPPADVNAMPLAEEPAVSEEVTPTDIPPTVTPQPTDVADDAVSATTVATAEPTGRTSGLKLVALVNVNARACPAVTCDVMTSYTQGAELVAVGAVDGAIYANSTTWFHIDYNGTPIYVHASLVGGDE